MKISKKINIFFALVVVIVVAVVFLFTRDFSNGKNPDFGVTFSKKYAEELNLDWRDAYRAMFTELGVNHVRLIAYWDALEATRDHYDFADLDWQIDEAEKNGAGVLLAVGRRTPRWPECHDPAWLTSLSPEEQQRELLTFVEAVITRYKDRLVITDLQVENEALFGWFGECPKPNVDALVDEVRLVRQLDTRPIIITDSGELNHWQTAAGIGDVLGITMYRVVWNQHFGFFDYWFVPPAVYTYKAKITQLLNRNLKEVIVTELQMEPWTFNKPMTQMTLEEQRQSFDVDRFRANIDYVRRTGFSHAYLWGVEYWYWLKVQGYPEIWDEAKSLW